MKRLQRQGHLRKYASTHRASLLLVTCCNLSLAWAFQKSLFLQRSPFQTSTNRAVLIASDPRAASPTIPPPPHTTTAASKAISLLQMTSSKNGAIEGLMDASELEFRNRVDNLIGKLQEQLPRTLLEPLTALSTDQVYDQDVQLSVLVPTSNKENPNEKDSPIKADKNNNHIPLAQSREELISLSDFLVLAITANKQAQSMLSFGGSQAPDGEISSNSIVDCQLIIDPNLDCIRITWKTKVPLLSSSPIPTTTSRNNNFVKLEGISDFTLNRDTGKIASHQVLQVFLNGRSINGPEVGQALQAIQSASKNLQQSPFFLPNVFGSNSNGNNQNQNDLFWKEMRDGILEQAATAAAASSRNNQMSLPVPQVLAVDSTKAVEGWISTIEAANMTRTAKDHGLDKIPLPGTDRWTEYTMAHKSLTEFCNQVIPMLAGTNPTESSAPSSPIQVEENAFATNVTFKGLDDKTLMEGRDMVGSFYRSLSLARRMGTGQEWAVTKFCVLDWRKRTIAIDYEATNSIPPRWKIQGRDMYVLGGNSSGRGHGNRPVIEEIKQLEFRASTADGSLMLDSGWLMKNLVRAVEQGRNVANGGADGSGMVNFGELLSDILVQQGGNLGLGGVSLLRPNSQGIAKSGYSDSSRISETGAANAYYLMSSLLEQCEDLFDDSRASGRNLVPGVAFLGESVELHGYLGETLVRGRNVYNRVLGTLLAGTRQSISQKQLSISSADTKVSKIELIAFDTVRLHLSYTFRLLAPQLPPDFDFGMGNGPAAFGSGIPLKIELVSDYKLDPNTGEVTIHKLVETKVNGQLTPGDVLSRWMQKFLNLNGNDRGTGTPGNGNDEFFQSFVDAISFIRILRPPDR